MCIYIRYSLSILLRAPDRGGVQDVQKEYPSTGSMCVLLSVIYTIIPRTYNWIEVVYVERYIMILLCLETMFIHLCRLESHHYKKVSEGVIDIENVKSIMVAVIIISQTKVEFSKSSTAKLIVMTDWYTNQ